MAKKELIVQYTYHNDLNEIDEEGTSILSAAVKIADQAYAPYSDFQVGAAVLLENGEVISGNNQENAAYPSGLCAERVAIFYAGANYPDVAVKAIGIYAKKMNDSGGIVSPCGACRQAISEYEQKQNQAIRVLLMNRNQEVWEFDELESLLPFSFQLSNLKK